MQGDAPDPWADGPRRKISRLVPRVAWPHETARAAMRVADSIPITRLADLTPLDPARAPVFCAVTPLARDLTTHLGKGPDADAARASALMEAVERVSAEANAAITAPMTRAAMQAAGRATVDPALFDLPPDGAWRPDLPCRWIEARCLMRGTPAWLPADLVLSPPSEGLLLQVDTNGLASGNTRLEAVLHGICEVIERDAAGQESFAALHGDPGDGPEMRRIATGGLPASCRAILGRLTAGGRTVTLDWLVSDIAVPVIRAVLTDPAYPGPDGPGARDFIGLGCDPSPEVALMRALSEAAQSLLAVVQGARDSFNLDPPPRRSVRSAPPPAPEVPFTALPGFESDDLGADLDFVLSALAAAGFGSVYAADLTRPDLGLPVVRVRVPGLTSFLVDRSRVGLRCLRWLL